MAEPIPTARLEEIRDGCEGVTPGPWSWGLAYVEGSDPGKTNGVTSHIFSDPGDLHDTTLTKWCANARHVSRLDPQTVSAIVSELLERRNKDKANG